MSAAQGPSPRPTDSDGSTRREFLERGVQTGLAIGVMAGGGSQIAPRYSPVGRAQALPPLVAAYGGYAAAAGASAAVGWALREYEVLGADDPPEGTTPETLHNTVYDDAVKRRSNNDSTFVDNRQIVETGFEHSLYSDGKIAGIEALNDQLSQSEVQDAAVSAAEEYAATVQSNLLKSWNETINEVESNLNGVRNHSDLSAQDVFYWSYGGTSSFALDEFESPAFGTETVQLADGSEFDVRTFNPDDGAAAGWFWNPTTPDEKQGNEDYVFHVLHPDETEPGSDTADHVKHQDWYNLWSLLEDEIAAVNDGLITWVDGVYGDVQAGELDTEDLLSSRELAEMTADEEDFNQAISDLMALNIAVDLEREAEVYLPSVGGTVYGQIATTSEGTLSTGTIDPSADEASYYLTYDVSQGEGEWSAFESGVDGGVVTFTQEPFEETEYFIDTVAGETATVTKDDFEEDDSGNWTVDVSDQLEDAVTEVDAIEFYATIEETQHETIQLKQEFEIVTFRDSDGNEHDSAEFTRSEPQDDTNYISQDEWEEMRARQEELIEKYEEESSGPLLGDPGEWIDGVGSNGAIGLFIVGITLGVGVLASLNPFN